MTDITKLLRWLHAHDEYDAVVFACDHVDRLRVGKRELGIIWNGCTIDMHIGIPAQVLIYGAKRAIFTSCDRHESELAECLVRWHDVLGDRVGWREALQPRLRRYGETFTIDSIPLPRRVVFGAVGSGPLDLSADVHARSLAALTALGVNPSSLSGAQMQVHTADRSGAGIALHVADCNACGVCVSACDRGALELVRNSSGHEAETAVTLTLTHDLLACRGSLTCIDLCPLGSIANAGPLDVGEILDVKKRALAAVPTRPCPQCGVAYDVREGELCALCTYRRNNRFGSASASDIANAIASARRRAQATIDGNGRVRDKQGVY